jgi:hypothetical protein
MGNSIRNNQGNIRGVLEAVPADVCLRIKEPVPPPRVSQVIKEDDMKLIIGDIKMLKYSCQCGELTGVANIKSRCRVCKKDVKSIVVFDGIISDVDNVKIENGIISRI